MGLLDKVMFVRCWSEVSRTNFTEEELAKIESIDVVAGEWGLSARVFINGTDKCTFYGLSKDCNLAVGDKLDPKKCVIVTLERGADTVEKLLYTDDVL